MSVLANHPIFTTEYFERLLRKDRSDESIRVLEVIDKPAVGKGENFASQMLRVSVKFAGKDAIEQTTSLIVKCELKSEMEQMSEMLEAMSVFRKEVACYTKILPAVHELLRSIGDETRLSPKCFDASVEHSYLVFEDLTASEYFVQKRAHGLSVAHYRLLFDKVARWHAATAYLLLADPDLGTSFHDDKYNPDNAQFQNAQRHCVIALADAAKKIPSLVAVGEKIEACLPQISDRVWQAMRRRDEPDSGSFNVIIHGDLWSNNVMFRSEASEPKDAILLDFQVCTHTSHVSDVLFALYTSAGSDLDAADWKSLVEYYYGELASILTKLKYPVAKIPTLEQLWAEFRRNGRGAAFSLPFVACLRLCPTEGGPDLVKMFGETQEDRDFRRDFVLEPTARKSVEFLLDYSDKQGFYDV